MSLEMNDVTGLGRPLAKLLDLIQAACGKLYEPTHIRRISKAQADSYKLIERAKTEALISTGSLIAGADPTLLLSIPGVAPEIAERARLRLAHQEAMRQENIDQVVAHAANSLPSVVSDEPVNPDWVTRFFSVAAEVSDVDMQALWGKILAGETARPGKFSVRTLEVLRNLSRSEAEIFRRACSLSFDAETTFMVRVPDKKPGRFIATDGDALASFGLSYYNRISLAEAGVLVATEDTSIQLDWREAVRLSYQGRRILFAPIEGSPKTEALHHGLPVIAFTKAGTELRTLIEDDFQHDYITLLCDRFKPYGYHLLIVE